MNAPWTEFFIALAATVVALGFVVWSGKTRRRKPHYVSVGFAAVGLGFAILYAERIGRLWDFPPVPLRIHLTLAYAATGMTLVAVVSGLLHAFSKISRAAHARLAWLTLACIVLATMTGIWIFTVGSPKG
ncbi:MAG: hypothetical protein H6833_07015 [Planctomycetes bacterium]|nr:hypothetical protein [Planctomycetota bacterium]